MFITCFSGSMFFRAQVLEAALKLILALNFSLLCHEICLQFFFFKYQCKKIYAPTLIVALKFSFTSFLFSEKFFWYIIIWSHKDFLQRNNLSVAQTMLSFLYKKENVLIFYLNIQSIFWVQTSFSSMLKKSNQKIKYFFISFKK